MYPLEARRPVIKLAFFVFVISFCSGAHAATGTLTAQTVVDTSCTVTTTGLTFGAYDPIVAHAASALDNGNTASVNITCIKGTTATIALGNGNFYVSPSGPRRMQNTGKASVFLNYELYKPPSNLPGTACAFPGATPWNSSNTLVAPSAPNKNSRTFNVCGTVPAAQDVEVGTYSDTVMVTVSF